MISVVGVEKLLCLKTEENLFKMEVRRRKHCLCAAGAPREWESCSFSHFVCDVVNLKKLCKKVSALIPCFARVLELEVRDVPAYENPNPFVLPSLCRYLHKPYLIGGKKFDLRLYVYVTCYDPLRVYLFKDGLVRFASCR